MIAMSRPCILIAAVLSIVASRWSAAAVKPAALFSDNAVLQQGLAVPVWGTAGDGEKVTVRFAGQTAVATTTNGCWMVKLTPLKADATPQTMTISGSNTVEIRNILVGEVWVCSGQSNMQYPLSGAANSAADVAAAGDPQLRLFSVPRVTAAAPRRDVEAVWQVCTPGTVAGFSAVAYYFGRDLRSACKVPVGLINTSFGGTPAEAWTARETLEGDPVLKKLLDDWEAKAAGYNPAKATAERKAQMAKHKEAVTRAKAAGKASPQAPRPQREPGKDPHRPACLFNAMVAPLLPYAIKGVIWYQGEANNKQPEVYKTLFPAMIRCWRNAWGLGDFPFLFVQIAPFTTMTPELREAQLISWRKTPGSAMVVITDYGEAGNIHPKHKAPVGARLALAARALAYGEKIEYSGPVFKSMKVDGRRAVLSFDHLGGGLVAKGAALRGFAVAGEDRNFVPADAQIEGDSVVVEAKDVSSPVAVRYGWANVPDVNLFNKAGLPATPFRTSEPRSGAGR